MEADYIMNWLGFNYFVFDCNIYSIGMDLQSVFEAKITNRAVDYSFFQGGLLILSDSTTKQFVLNCFTNESYQTQIPEINSITEEDESIIRCLELCECGLTIPFRLILRIMRKKKAAKFLTTREEYYENYRFEQFSNPNFPMEEINLILLKAELPVLTAEDFHLNKVKYRNKMKTISL